MNNCLTVNELIEKLKFERDVMKRIYGDTPTNIADLKVDTSGVRRVDLRDVYYFEDELQRVDE